VPVAAVAEIVENSVALINEEAKEAVAPVNVCLAVNDCAIPSPATVALDDGNVIVVASVPAKVSELLAVKVLPSAIVRVALVDVVPVPPLAIGSVPVTPVVRGKPVKLVAVPEVGVPNIGVTRVGEVANTKEPVPVSSVTALIKLALDGVPKKVATPVPKLVIPVPPLATGSVPVTPVVKGSPVALVSVAEAGVPRAIALPDASKYRPCSAG